MNLQGDLEREVRELRGETGECVRETRLKCFTYKEIVNCIKDELANITH